MLRDVAEAIERASELPSDRRYSVGIPPEIGCEHNRFCEAARAAYAPQGRLERMSDITG